MRWLVNSRPGHLTLGKDPVPIIWEAGFPRAGLNGCGNLAPTGIQTPHRPARSESLYRLSYRGPYYFYGYRYY